MTAEPHQPWLDLEHDLEVLLELLWAILEKHPAGFKEYDLLKRLELEGLVYFEGSLDDELVLFRQHFLLFHLLYLLRDRLRQDGVSDLHIHCLSIRLIPLVTMSRGSRAVAPEDPLRTYYLDWDHCRGTNRQDVIDMIRGFHQQVATRSSRDEALRVFGLTPHAGPGAVKQRFRELVRTHHPDFGGDRARFHQVMVAARVLLPIKR
ncbi:DNA-J related domain-containing protein [Acanthopleuribacter pedis]|uniref:DnaJ-related protein N-terminal domain-containing protein n=1 Tax=Acanthopleuribacter pedis TaxID=442870 RepID=A0A8J7U4M3_9BACT|nr:DNA-J related domain-containing protein [Acanthopleuribacter pedis]MBO1321633.1 hypothetical protein [Acanthopleuribacter pedis]